ncbi:glutathione S-transferase family protein [Zavarzinia compransoris]|uniref:glutathione S-transferase family protein n=1 Tax=Zavarzinia marina TaxID=2911065 RepID=UPI001F1E3D25|nr:glutathione S-transferase family protein [Zavarzinia marina]MCF4165029.1 glutathione S-transferase family protein [Zavarzinia marina]
MTAPYILHGWHLSYYSGKMRGYLRYKGIPFVEKKIDALTLLWRIPARTGVVVMPVVQTPEGRWLQDTTDIIAELERCFPARPVLPQTPRQRLAAMMIEAWADEWWIPPALHYRWSFPENYALFEHDAGTALAPFGPGLLQRLLARRAARTLRGYLDAIGVVPEQHALIERWTVAMLDALEHHFEAHPYLLGGAPSLADFALIGPLYAHLGRDPAPLRDLVTPRRRLRAWIERTHDGRGAEGTWLPDDALPATLTPVLRSIFGEFFPLARTIGDSLTKTVAAMAAGEKKLSRTLGPVTTTMQGEPFRRDALPYTLWMAQRIQDEYRAMNENMRGTVQGWLGDHDATGILDDDFGPRLRRDGLGAALA